MLRDTAADELAAVCAVDDFFLPAHREIYEAMLHLRNLGRTPGDVVMLADELHRRGQMGRLDGGEAYLLKLTNAVPTAENIGHYARIVRGKAKLRKLIAACAETISRAHGDVEAGALMGQHQGMVEAIDPEGGGATERVGALVTATMEAIDQKQQRPDGYQVLTHIARFDREYGGYRGGQLIMVAGRPGTLKTGHALTTACRQAMAGVPGLVFSLEMGKHELVERLLAFLAKVEGRKVARGTLDYAEWRQLDQAKRPLLDIPLWINDDVNLSAEAICAEASRWAREVDPGRATGNGLMKTIVVDSMSLTSPEREGKTRYDDVTKVSRMFKKLAKRLKCPVVLIVHTKRPEGKKVDHKPGIHELKESGALEQDADVIIFPWHEQGQAGAATGPVDALLIVGKSRDGAPSEIPVSLDKRYMAFYDQDGV